MADTDLIARVYPFQDDRLFLHARNAIENSLRCMPPMQQREKAHQSRSSRESTESREDGDNMDTLPYLELRFSKAPRTSSGLVFGTDTNICDVVLPNFADKRSRLIVRDLGSRHGTIVTYNDKGGTPRSEFDWIIDGFRLPNETKTLIVQLHETLMFRIIVAHHDITSPAYANNVERFYQGAADAQDLLGGLGLQSGPDTKRNTGAHTPAKQPILLPLGWVGKGGFGVDNIVRVCFSRTSPSPLLYLEYMAFGNLENEHSKAHFSHEECVTILHQSASALRYLHERSEPVAHRDLKPENILIQHRDRGRNPNSLCIKLSDFGLAKIGNSLKTGCGSETYCPPEICASHSRQRYTKAVDIWSLGVVILRFAYALPYPGSGRMLVIDAKARCSAADCWYEASRLLVSSQGRSTTPTPASYAAGYGAAAAMPLSTGQGREEKEVLRILPYKQFLSQDIDGVPRDAPVPDLDWPSPSLEDYLDDDPDIFSENRRFLRSNGPPPVSASLISGLTGKISPGRSVADANQHPDGGVNIAQWENGEVVQNAWTDSEQYVAAALLGLNQMVPAQPGFTGLGQPENSVSEYRQRSATTPSWSNYLAGQTQVFAPLPNNPFSLPQPQAQSPVPAPVSVQAVPTPTPHADRRPSARESLQDRFLHVESHFGDALVESSTEDAPTPSEHRVHPPENSFSQPQPQPQSQLQAQEQPQPQALLAPLPVSVLAVPARAPVTYWKLKYAGAKVMYRPDDGLVNITQLIHALGYRKQLRWPRMEIKIGNMDRTFVNGRHVVGTYVSMTNAESILLHLKLRTALLQELAKQITEYRR
ncbi:hypothetical protein F5883DRAFT_721545 [Diaporthe sp. PMI_573]|nr:hypothetical protein F5883DRAFT_721545 [Diaporthaceae sp. PMI_573]